MNSKTLKNAVPMVKMCRFVLIILVLCAFPATGISYEITLEWDRSWGFSDQQRTWRVSTGMVIVANDGRRILHGTKVLYMNEQVNPYQYWFATMSDDLDSLINPVCYGDSIHCDGESLKCYPGGMVAVGTREDVSQDTEELMDSRRISILDLNDDLDSTGFMDFYTRWMPI